MGRADDEYDAAVRALRVAGCVFAEDEARLLLEDGRAVAALVARRATGEPLEQILGWAQFGALRIGLLPGVFVPRRRTELLAAQATICLPEGGRAVDLCCGAGAIAAWLEDARPDAEIWAADIDPVATACAARNLARTTVLTGDLYDALPDDLRGRVDVLVANTPYVPTDELAFLPPEAREHEPRYTLDGGPDGLALLRRIATDAIDWLTPGGRVLIEIGAGQREAARAAFSAAGLTASFVEDAEVGTVVAVGG